MFFRQVNRSSIGPAAQSRHRSERHLQTAVTAKLVGWAAAAAPVAAAIVACGRRHLSGVHVLPPADLL